MNSGHMNVHHNDPDKFIGYPEYFHYYFIWLLYEHEVTNIQTSPAQVINIQLYVVSTPHLLTYITICTYIRPIKCKLQILNFIKAPEKDFGIVIIK